MLKKFDVDFSYKNSMRQNFVEITLAMKTNLRGWVVKIRKLSFPATFVDKIGNMKNKDSGKICSMFHPFQPNAFMQS